ncbi:FecR family protein [Mesorhizobium sp. YR577]|uniref:FecR family protein n=1 Tax=Mesorhizobium sp. YR577 TaxID=1884373 RepID=UPI001FCDE614|nr:FecR family protein [Mesorhizobium sp. YR577]
MGKRDDYEQIEAEAAEWVIRLGGASVSERDRREFDVWRSKSPKHIQAFDFALKTWGELASLRSEPSALTDDLEWATLQRSIGVPSAPSRSFGLQRLWHLAALSICLLAAIGFGGFWYGNPVTMLMADYRAALGETRTVTLPDGSSVDLSSGSAIALHFDKKERRIELLQGEAYFTAAPMVGDETRPFVVQGDIGTATALGTQFLVDRHSDAVEVVVAEHEVRVALAGSHSQAASVVLSPGQSVRYSSAKGMGKVSERNVELASAWRRGRLVFDQMPLGDVVAELNRYRRGRIVISNSALASRKVSGVFETNDLDDALNTISTELRLRVVAIPPLVTVLY